MSILNYFRLGTVEITKKNGDREDVPALIYGDFAITESIFGYTVTTPSNGRRDGNEYPTLEAAARIIALFNGVPIAWDNENTDIRATWSDMYGENTRHIQRILRTYRDELSS